MPTEVHRSPASFAQQRLWFFDQLEPGSPAYNIPIVRQLSGPLDTDALARSLNEIVRRHEVLRTTFEADGEAVLQVIAPSLALPLPLADLRGIPQEERDAKSRALIEEEAARPFDLSRGPLIRAGLVRLDEEEHLLLLTLHHIAADGWSLDVLFSELAVLYDAFRAGKASPLPDLEIQYADYAAWQREWLQGEVLDQQLSYWRRQLAGIPEALELPADRPRPPVQRYRGGECALALPAPLAAALRDLSRRERATLFMTLLAAWKVLLSRLTGQEDIVVGTPIAGRTQAEVEGLIGFFVNTLVLRTDLSGNPTFRDALARVRGVSLDAYEHQDLPFEKLVEELHPERSLSRHPLFQVVLAVQRMAETQPELPGLSMRSVPAGRSVAKFDLSMHVQERADTLHCSLQYNTDLFGAATVERLLGQFHVLLEGIAADPGRPIAELPILTEGERRRILTEWNDTDTDYPRDRCIQELFESQAARAPEAIALIFEGRPMTYGEVNARANQIAHLLRKHGVGPDGLVGIHMERSPDLIVAMLGVLKAGGAYVPLDTAYPKERLAFMLEDTRLPVVLAHEQLLGGLPDLCGGGAGASAPDILCVDRDRRRIDEESTENPPVETTPESLAYVIYTSGSTGRPKGVCVPHRGVLRLVINTNYVRLGAEDVVGQVSNTSFDAATFEVWGALLNGARLAILPKDTALSPVGLERAIHEGGITVMFLTTALFNHVAAENPSAFRSMDTLLFGGEAADARAAASVLRASPPRRLLNAYGPTETTTFATTYEITAVPEGAASVPIGRPIANTQTYVLDRHRQPVPVGVVGELYVGGDGLARGYLNRPELTSERFVRVQGSGFRVQGSGFRSQQPDAAECSDTRPQEGGNSLSGRTGDQASATEPRAPNPEPSGEPRTLNPEPSVRLYKTGDLARYLPDGSIEYLGRVDHQVKLRGFRIELGEIEAVLGQHPQVCHAVVVLREDVPDDKRLVAYVVMRDGGRGTGGGSGSEDGETGRQGDGETPGTQHATRGNDPSSPVHPFTRSPVHRSTPTLPAVELRAFLKERLPEYMVPSAFVWLEALPLTPSGKVDRRALPTPGEGDAKERDAPVLPRTHAEEVIAGIWAEMLHLPRVSVHDSFFERGGHSLLAARANRRVAQAFGVDLPLRALFEAPTVAALAQRVEALVPSAEGSGHGIVAGPSGDGGIPLSFAQERLWFLHQWDRQSPAYNIPVALRLAGTLNVAALERALNEVVRRHAALRTTFTMRDGSPVQVIAPAAARPLPVVDVAPPPDADPEAEALWHANEEAKWPFDLVSDPPIRWLLLRLGGQAHVLVLTMHHIASDGWSLGVLFQELAALYGAFDRGMASPLPELPIQYADHARWQREWLQGEELQRQIAYWRRNMEGAPPALEMPADRPRPAVRSSRGAHETLLFRPDLAQSLKALGRQERATLFMVMLSAWKCLLARYSHGDDIVVGTPIAGRNREETEALIGFFVNTLVLRSDLSGNPTFRELLRRVRETCLGAYEHQELPFEKLVEELRPERDPSRSPLFQVLFALQNAPMSALELPGLEVCFLRLPTTTAKFDLSLAAHEAADGLTCSLEYSTDLFDAPTVARMLGHFRVLLEGIAADPDRPLAELPILTEGERRQILVEWNETSADYPRGRCVHQLFEAQVKRTPDAVALVYGSEETTYRELNRQANHLAHYLSRRGVGPESLVGICTDRSPAMVGGLLGILKAGGAYVPLDPTYPPERLAFMVEDARMALLLTQQPLLQRLPIGGTPVVCMDAEAEAIAAESGENPARGVAPEDLAYVIYTSGSTGKPKGVTIEHRNTVAFIEAARRTFTAEELSGVLASTSICFDFSIIEIFVTLSSGGQAILAENVLALPKLPVAGRVTLVTTVPSAMAELLRAGADFASVRAVALGGEAVSRELAHAVYERTSAERVLNIYGPAETTTFSTSAVIARGAEGPVPIGRPIRNTQVYLLDRHLQPVPVGVPGEIHIGGDGVARGYLNRPELTAERFVRVQGLGFRVQGSGFRVQELGAAELSGARPQRGGCLERGRIADGAPLTEPRTLNPEPSEEPRTLSPEPSVRLYKTGDLARYLPDGSIEYLGRADRQVKLRGFRIELGEIEAVLRQYPQVRDAVVVLREDAPGDKRLVAYVATGGGRRETGDGETGRRANGETGKRGDGATRGTQHATRSTAPAHPFTPTLPTGELRAFLAAKLPEYMVPSVFVVLDTLPCTPSGKLDRGALPAPTQQAHDRVPEDAGPSDALEAQLAAIWAKVLGVSSLSVTDNFFEMGGHSLLTTRLLAQVRRVYGKDLPLTTLFQAPTVRQFAAVLREEGCVASGSSLVPIQPAGSKPPFFCVHGALGHVLVFRELAYRLGLSQPFYALQPRGLDGKETPHSSVEEMAAAYLAEIRLLQPEGPYFLGGYSFGGVVAFEMAQRLRAEEQEVGLLALIDSPDPRVPLRRRGRALVEHTDPGGDPPEQHKPRGALRLLVGAAQRLKWQAKQAVKRVALTACQGMGRPLPRFVRSLRIQDACLTALARYSPRAFPGSAVLFCSDAHELDPAVSWNGLAGLLQVHRVPGNHWGILEYPGVQDLADTLGHYLDGRQPRDRR